MPESDLAELEQLRTEGGFSNRSEVIRHALQSLLSEHRTLEDIQGAVTAICTVVYSLKGKDILCHHVQHEYSMLITSMLHAHSENGSCIEVLVVRGEATTVTDFIKALRSQKKVSRVEVVLVGK
jgi:CopG family nickel-responsive transcriptional regulator